ncbi:MAG: hypothetical protein HOP12_14955 [Candidatus Eisenbacteria bacterium]|uniref:Uncharacterized protein n=1 Tax=Eiseniibacteriota bacterium TaxID=2212470 RepID=A0A849SJ77_UNCEI|nr:hypothetical protein [Candidatus Eisenbacteria bacterium]
MARAAASVASGSFDGVLRWGAWALALFAFASAFTNLGAPLRGGLRWALTFAAILLAGRAMGSGRRMPFFVYGVMALVLNPWRPFAMSVEMWRLALAASAIWLVADHLPGRK